jgi:hypothetical protein
MYVLVLTIGFPTRPLSGQSNLAVHLQKTLKIVQGFFCMDGTFPEGVVADGCRKQCLKDEVLIVNVAENSWNCVPKSVRDI